jgi:hypothetical protein
MWLQTYLLVREGYGAATCHVALGPQGVSVRSQDV